MNVNTLLDDNVIDITTIPLGNSKPAKKARKAYQCYEKDHKYSDLTKCFQYLYEIVSLEPYFKNRACFATLNLAKRELNVHESVYKKYYLTNAVTSIHVRANVPYPESWSQLQEQFSKAMSDQGFDQNEALKAGLAVLETEEK